MRSKRGRQYQCTYSKCRKRFHTKQPIECYVRQPSTIDRASWAHLVRHGTCPVCRRGRLSDCTRHVSRWNRRIACLDDGCPKYPLPHAVTARGCVSHPDGVDW